MTEIIEGISAEEERRRTERRVMNLFSGSPELGCFLIPHQDLFTERRKGERRGQPVNNELASNESRVVTTTDDSPKDDSSPELSVFNNPDLIDEITDVGLLGYTIEVTPTADQAYENPSKITQVFTKLHILGKKYAQMRRIDAREEVGGSALSTMFRRSKKVHEKRRELRRENIRHTLLYGPVRGEAWHAQRGSATALLTIQEAHNLKTDSNMDGIYPTMSAMLDSSVLNHQFGNENSLAGQTLREALISTGTRFYGKNVEVSTRYADRKLNELQTFIDTPASSDFRDIVGYCSDSLGIRSRKEIVRQVIGDYVSGLIEEDPECTEILLLSVGCGTALPIFEVALDARKKGVEMKLLLLDQDPIALASAVVLAKKMGLEDNIEIHCERLFSKFGKPIDMKNLLKGRKLNIVEDSGLREYLPDRIYKALAKESWNALSAGGMMTTGNMNTNRPQHEFLDNLMGWLPKVKRRKIRECINLHEKAGIPRGSTEMKVTQDGVYTVYISKKVAG